MMILCPICQEMIDSEDAKWLDETLGPDPLEGERRKLNKSYRFSRDDTRITNHGRRKQPTNKL